ncbi:amidohydrolase [Perlabentimonas gracilis]|uniref:amidohydrolase n=1 Tax=Perlabentimonas gracilis TaxID=2715279 RepID=UPI00140D276E|nr:amidohydrolase [Perlabentimonas gracilis]NHB69127.1 amidohydrolase [Perlabentimonas gracilis]
MTLDSKTLRELIDFRKYLHQNPELSGQEKQTSKTIENFLKKTNPSSIVTGLGGHGLAAVYNSGKAGPTVLLRADMDALPIQESNSFEYRSKYHGVAHLCGHDGHSTILAGVAVGLQKSPLKKGRVILLFQPAEETGQGAAAVIADEKFKPLTPDYAFALHNLPGFKRGQIYLREGTFASASTGLIAKLKGLSSHAAHPEDGNNPDLAMAKMILELNNLVSQKERFDDFTLLTVIHAKLGEVAFGTTPGNATLMATLRTYLDTDMEILKAESESIIKHIGKENNIKVDITYTEEFPATINSSECTALVQRASSKLDLQTHQLKNPFRWSEDFGHFTQLCKANLFGVGSGENHPQLHNEDYDFPDDIIEPSVNLFREILELILNN